jgi:hypothetical protein
MELRKFIATTIREYLNEGQILNENSKMKLYRGYFKQTGVYPKNDNAAIYFTPSIEYAKTYGDGSVISTNIPNNIFNIINNKNHQSIMKMWLIDKIEQISNEKEDIDGFLPKIISIYLKDAKKNLNNDDPKSLMIAFQNISFAYFDGNNKVGVLEKLFMEENNIDAMYQFEAGLINSELDKISVAFKNMPKYEAET